MSKHREKTTQELTLLYDARCGLCQRTVRTLRNIRTSVPLHMLPLQQADSTKLPVPLNRDELMAELHVIDSEGDVYAGSEAVFRILREVPRLRWLAVMQRIPGMRGLSRRWYGWIARNRYALFGEVNGEDDRENGYCSIHRK